MKIIQLHCDYSSIPISGENRSVTLINEALFEILGTDIEILRFSTIELQSSIVKRLFALRAYLKKDHKICEAASDSNLVIIHNTVPFVSSRTIRYLLKSKIVVFTWHNSRRLCIAGINAYNGQACFKCEQNSYIFGLIRKCYRNDFLQSFFVSINEWQNRRLLSHKHARHLVFNEDMKNRILLNHTISQENIYLLEHYLDSRLSSPSKNAKDFLAIGRLDPSKGFLDLVQIWNLIPREQREGVKLHLVGDGSDKERLSTLIVDESIILHGVKTQSEIREIATSCRVGIVPSIGPETFGRVVVEYMSLGLIPIVRPAGALKFLVERINPYWVAQDLSKEKLMEKLIWILQYSENETENLHQYVRRNFSKKQYLQKFEIILEKLMN